MVLFLYVQVLKSITFDFNTHADTLECSSEYQEQDRMF